MTRMRRILMAGAVLALVGAAACSDNVVGPQSDTVFDPGAYLAEREAAWDDGMDFREPLIGDEDGQSRRGVR